MDNMREIESIVSQAAASTLPPSAVRRVHAEPMVDWVGEPGLQVLIVVDQAAMDKVTDDQALNTLHNIQEQLRGAGEDRFAYVEYATEDDLAEDADIES